MNRVANCFICSTSTGAHNTISLIQDTSNLQSGKKLLDIVSEIAEKPLQEEDIHSTVICKKCSQTCKEYDDLQVRLKHIKTELHEQIHKTSESPTKSEGRKIVLPASKLHPLPPDFVLKVGHLPSTSGLVLPIKNKNTTIPSTLSLKVTVGSSVLTQSIKTTSALAQNIIIQNAESDEQADNSNELIFEETSLPRDFMTSVVLKRLDQDGDINNDDQPMEIDEECSYTIVTQEEGTNDDSTEKEKSEPSNMFDVQLLSTLEDSEDGEQTRGQYIVGKLEILSEREDEDEEEPEIVMSSDSSVLRVLAGPQSGADQDDEDSQIELQVSGDEETANAIIAAAREQGGAFIKVESGEMYRVKSVQSKPNDDEEKEIPDHMQIVENVDGVFKCLLCKRNKNKASRAAGWAGSAATLMRHVRAAHAARAYICGTCARVLRRRDLYTRHLASRAAGWAGSAATLMRHVRAAHAARAYICGTCARVLRRRDLYTRHLAQHAKENKGQDKIKLHECDVCHKKYSNKTLLAQHMNLHQGQRPYSCEICHKTFASKYTHQSHLKTHLDRPRPFKCADCGKCFYTLQNLNQHHKTHSGIKEFECTVCGKAFGTQHNLEMHGVVHSGQKPFVCGVCGKGFARRAEVKDHMRTHTGERPFACDVCGATFSQRSNLHSHKRATHYDDKRYTCDQCPKRFKRRRLLDYHIKASHTGERPLKCEVCTSTFVYPEHYKKHIRIHSGEKPYVCEVCGKSFNSRDNRNTHRFVHSDKKPYECLVCGAGYMRKQLLYTHMNTSGHLAESIVVNQPRVTVQKISSAAPVDAVYESTEEWELDTEGAKAGDNHGTVYIGDKKYILQESSGSLSLVQDSEEFLTYNLGELKTDTNLIEAVTEEQIGDESQQAGGGGAVRVVQVALPDGARGWLAVNP